jgi:sulfite exporter TauE/SafE
LLPAETPIIIPDRTAHILGILSIVLGICSSGILGIILGIIGLTNAKTADNKALNIVGIIISVILLFLGSLIAAGISGK